MLKLGTIDEFKSVVNNGGGFTKGNLFYVKFPTIQGLNAYDLGLLCSDVALPTRQMNSIERDIGVIKQQVVYGFTNPSVSMTFRVLNDQKVREYFERWQQYILPTYDEGEARLEARFPDQYVAPIHIYQLKRAQSFPLFSKQFDVKLGPINLNLDIDLDIGQVEPIASYHWHLDRAYPISQTSSNLSEGDGEVSTVTVEFAYKSWRAEKLDGKQSASIIIN